MSHVHAISLLLLSGIVVMTNIATAFGDDPSIRITTKRDGDRVEVKDKKNKAKVSIHSPFGISQAVIERRGENWPDSVKLRMHLKGLEQFKVANGKTTIEAAVSSHNGKVRIWKDGKENSPLDSNDPFWIEIRMFGKDGRPTTSIPLKDGYFEIQLPKALLENDPKSITLNWIDFYR